MIIPQWARVQQPAVRAAMRADRWRRPARAQRRPLASGPATSGPSTWGPSDEAYSDGRTASEKWENESADVTFREREREININFMNPELNFKNNLKRKNKQCYLINIKNNLKRKKQTILLNTQNKTLIRRRRSHTAAHRALLGALSTLTLLSFSDMKLTVVSRQSSETRFAC